MGRHSRLDDEIPRWEWTTRELPTVAPRPESPRVRPYVLATLAATVAEPAPRWNRAGWWRP
jgi:hypothetical protein